MTTNIFIVTQGSYSDYSIRSVWLTLEEAQAAQAKLDNSYDSATIEVWPVGTGKRTLGAFYRNVDLDYATGETINEWSSEYNTLHEASIEVLYWPTYEVPRIGIRVCANTQRRANKVFAETKARVLYQISDGMPPETIANRFFSDDRQWHPMSQWQHHPIAPAPPRPRRAGEVVTGETELWRVPPPIA